jgi:hypothetical protein
LKNHLSKVVVGFLKSSWATGELIMQKLIMAGLLAFSLLPMSSVSAFAAKLIASVDISSQTMVVSHNGNRQIQMASIHRAFGLFDTHRQLLSEMAVALSPFAQVQQRVDALRGVLSWRIRDSRHP